MNIFWQSTCLVSQKGVDIRRQETIRRKGRAGLRINCLYTPISVFSFQFSVNCLYTPISVFNPSQKMSFAVKTQYCRRDKSLIGSRFLHSCSLFCDFICQSLHIFEIWFLISGWALHCFGRLESAEQSHHLWMINWHPFQEAPGGSISKSGREAFISI